MNEDDYDDRLLHAIERSADAAEAQAKHLGAIAAVLENASCRLHGVFMCRSCG